jgi:transposase
MSKPLRMHQIRRIIEMQLEGRSIRQTVRLTNLSRNTVRDYLRRMSSSGLELNELLSLDDEALSALMYVDASEKATAGRAIDNRHTNLKTHLESYCLELKKRGVTRQLLWEEYRKAYPDGYGYTQFCAYLNQHLRLDEAVMHFTHQPAESSQIDFAGKKLGYVDRSTGEWIECETLVCVLPFSHYMYVEAIRSQKQEHFIAAMSRFKKFLGGVTTCIKMDNMRTAVLRSNRYEPVFTEAMEYFAAHYGTTAITARVRKPRDKGSVEKAVDLSYKHIYAPLRNHTFYSLEELNAAIRKQVELFNSRPFKNKPGSRKELFEQYEKPALKPLPSSDYEIKHTTDSKVQRNYHVIVGEDRHQYSVPYKLIGKRLKIIYTADMVEIYDGLKRVALHKRSYQKNGYTTNIEHRPPNHQKVVEQRAWDDEYFLRNASYIGQSVQTVVQRILTSKGFYEQTYNSCLGILRLGKKYGGQRLEAACKRALVATKVNYGIVENILKNNLDKLSSTAEDIQIPDHHQIRGPKSYQ